MKRVILLVVIVLITVFGFVVFKPDASTSVTSVVSTTEKESPIPQNDFIPVPTISIYPEIIYPGDPVFITINSSTAPASISLGIKPLKTFQYDGKTHALTPIDFSDRSLKKNISVTFQDGKVATTSLTITQREKIEKPLGIPEKLGGNTPEASKALMSNLANENASLNSVKTASTILWAESFEYPLSSVFITDDYGYDRKTVGQTIVHKGTDFRARIGTKVLAMNDGIVEVATKYTVYGNTVVIDHGLGVHTLYMHLSSINVKKGDKVKAGDIIGLSGDTGYADAAHLHISVKIDGVSVDPVTFLEFFR